MYHLELRHFPHNHCRFNMTDEQVRVIVEPWVRERVVELGERKWSPHQARLTILEGPQLAVEQLSMGRGWRTAQRESVDVTERLLSAANDVKEAAEAKHAADAAHEAGRAILAEQAEQGEQGGHAEQGGPAQPGGLVTPARSGADAQLLADPLALGAQLASLLGSDPSELLAAWRAVAARDPGLAPSDSLALAEREIGDSAGNPS